MKIYTEILQPKLEKIQCDFCGKVAKYHEFQGAYDCNITFGYPSDYDCYQYKFDVCDDCFKKYFSHVIKKVKPKIF